MPVLIMVVMGHDIQQFIMFLVMNVFLVWTMLVLVMKTITLLSATSVTLPMTAGLLC